jgi:hypothetical protein
VTFLQTHLALTLYHDMSYLIAAVSVGYAGLATNRLIPAAVRRRLSRNRLHQR